MLKAGLIGIGFMGRGHLDNYIRFEKEGFPVKLAAICDIDPDKFKGIFIKGNLNVGNSKYDFSRYHLYTDIDEMLDKEDIDCVDIALPTYLHAKASVKALNKGLNVFCEKPMALNRNECKEMIDAANKNGKRLMIGHCLRFWPGYEYLKECVDSKKYGNVNEAYFFRGGSTPSWSYGNWLLKGELSGGALLDQHIHDVDEINWLFGMPLSVSTFGKKVIKGSGFDIVSTNYIYDDRKIVTAQDDWTLNGDFGFEASYRVAFEKANIVFERGALKVNPHNEKGFTPNIEKESAYYKEMKFFYESIINNTSNEIAPPQSAMETIKIAEAEIKSANEGGKLISVE